jgi:hypothetical protein
MQAAQQAASLLYLLDADEHTQYADTHPSGDFDDRTFTMAEVHQEHIQALMRERIASCNAIESLKMEQYHIQIEEVDSYFYNSSGDILHEISSTYSTEFEIVSIAEGNGQSVAN